MKSVRHGWVPLGALASVVLLLYFGCMTIKRKGEEYTMDISGTNIERRYTHLVEDMLSDIRNDPAFAVYSTRPYKRHGNFRVIASMGPAIVPLLMRDLENTKETFPLDVLDVILSDVPLGALYGNADYRIDNRTHRSFWIRWWNEQGKSKSWQQ